MIYTRTIQILLKNGLIQFKSNLDIKSSKIVLKNENLHLGTGSSHQYFHFWILNHLKNLKSI